MTNKKQDDEVEQKSNSYSEKTIPELLKITDGDINEARKISYEIFADKKKSKATEFIARFIESTNHIYTLRSDKETEVWIYQNGIYVQQGKCLIKEQSRKILGSGTESKLLSDILMKIELDTMTDIDFFFNQTSSPEFRHLIPINNGLFNIKTSRVEPFNPKIIFTTKVPVNYNPNATCPTIDQFLKDVLVEKETIELFFEIAGFSIYREYFIEKAFMFEGFGRNGKTKTQELLRNFIGIENTCSVPLSEIVEGSFSVSELFKKHLNVAGDISHGELKDTSTFRKTIGRDRINAKRKFMNDIKFTNHAKHIFSCNELPKTYDVTRGFWDKWILTSFNQTFVEQKEYDTFKTEEERKNKHPLNPNIIDSLITQDELDGMFLKALEGLKKILKKKEFSYTKNSEETKQAWIRKSDSFLTFALENLDIANSDDMILKSRIRKHYFDYCKEHSLRGASDMVVKITLQENFGVDEHRNHEQQTFWTGLKIKAGSKYQNAEERITDKQKKEIDRLNKEANSIIVTYEKPYPPESS